MHALILMHANVVLNEFVSQQWELCVLLRSFGCAFFIFEEDSMEREELLQNLYEAKGIIQQAETLTKRYNSLKSQLLNLQTHKKVEDRLGFRISEKLFNNKITKILRIIFSIILIFYFIEAIFNNSTEIAHLIPYASSAPRSVLELSSEAAISAIKSDICKIVLDVVAIVAVIFIPKIDLKLSNKRIARINKKNKATVDEKNTKIMVHNQQIEQEANEVNYAMQEIRQLADERLYWYPRNYCYSDAVNFFIEAVQNFRADSLKEAINLYVEELRHREILSTQQQLVYQQKISNVLSTANLFANLSTASAIRENTSQVTSAMNNQTNSINSTIKNTARYIRTGNKDFLWKK